MISKIDEIEKILQESVTIAPEKASLFFKTGIGEYGHGDIFMGIKVPTLRLIAKKFQTLALSHIHVLLTSPINEKRLLALFILTHQYQHANTETKEQLYHFYLDTINHINNWNLVDASCHLIIGAHLFEKDKTLLHTLAQSKNIWKRRIAIISTLYFIRKNKLDWTFTLASVLMHDSHDLIHKAVGWMLREAGKRNTTLLVQFLNEHAHSMPRTMLRYAIEKFPDTIRKKYLIQKK